MLKCTTDTKSWWIFDSERGWRIDANLRNYKLSADGDSAEAEFGSAGTAAEFLSNGVKLRTTDNEVNDSGDTYIYMAFAETPFKYSNGGQYTSSPP